MNDSVGTTGIFRAEDCDPAVLALGTAYPPGIADPLGGRVLRRLSRQAGLRNLAVIQVELPPGSALSLRLWQSHEEEFFLVLEGNVTLVTGRNEAVLTKGDCIGFRPGGPDGHQFVNRSAATAVLLEIADIVDANETTYSDHDLRAVTRDGKRIFVNRADEPLPVR